MIINFIKDWTNELSALFGAIVQFLIVGKNKKHKIKFFIFLIISTLFTMFYITEPIVVYYKLSEPYDRVIYAFNGLLSLELISILLNVFPKALKQKILDTIGVQNVND